MNTKAAALSTMVFGAALTLVGCGSIPSVTSDDGPWSVPSQPAGISRTKAGSGIAECPTIEPLAPRTDGLPDTTLECLGGGPSVNLAGLRGTPTIISVWAQWCGPCRAEAPILRDVVPELEAQGIRFLGADFYDPLPTAAIDFARKAGWRFPQLFAPNRNTFWSLRVTAPPQAIFIAASGKVVAVHRGGFLSRDELRVAAQDAFGLEATDTQP